MDWDKATDIILYAALAIVGLFAMIGLIQLIKRKSLKKVDTELLMMPIPLALMAATFVVFDKLIVLNTRPDGTGEPSFPSTHAMIAGTVFLLAALALPKYIKSKPTLIFLDSVMLFFFILICVGRVLANKHWISDVVAGGVFAAIFGVIYYLIIRRKHE